MSSLVVQTSFLGDMVLTTPLIAELAKRGPVDVVATPANAGLLANNPDVREVIVYDKSRFGIKGLIKVSRMLAKNRYDNAYLAQGSVRSGALSWLGRCKNRVGFNTSAGKHFYTQRVLYRDDLHHAARLLSLAGIDEVTRPKLYPGNGEVAAVDALNLPSPFVVLAPGSVWATKRWPYFAELAGLLSKSFKIVIAGSAQDKELAGEISQTVPDAVDTTGKLSLLASAELIRRAAMLVTNDSAPQHLASAMNTPTITIFGPTVPEFGFGPLAERSRTVGHDTLRCRPCDRHGPMKCPLRHWHCMRELNANYVYGITMDMINGV